MINTDKTMSDIATIIRDSIKKQGIKVIPYISANVIHFKKSGPDTTQVAKIRVFDLNSESKHPNITFYSNDVSLPVTLKVLHDLYGEENHQFLEEQAKSFKSLNKEIGFSLIKDIRLFKRPILDIYDKEKITVIGNIKCGFNTFLITDISSFYFIDGQLIKRACIAIPQLNYVSSALSSNNFEPNTISLKQAFQSYLRKSYLLHNGIPADSLIDLSEQELWDFTKVIEMLEY